MVAFASARKGNGNCDYDCEEYPYKADKDGKITGINCYYNSDKKTCTNFKNDCEIEEEFCKFPNKSKLNLNFDDFLDKSYF